MGSRDRLDIAKRRAIATRRVVERSRRWVARNRPADILDWQDLIDLWRVLPEDWLVPCYIINLLRPGRWLATLDPEEHLQRFQEHKRAIAENFCRDLNELVRDANAVGTFVLKGWSEETFDWQTLPPDVASLVEIHDFPSGDGRIGKRALRRLKGKLLQEHPRRPTTEKELADQIKAEGGDEDACVDAIMAEWPDITQIRLARAAHDNPETVTDGTLKNLGRDLMRRWAERQPP
jgi:hypothetical protein